MRLTQQILTYESAYLELEQLASEPYTQFVYSDGGLTVKTQRYLFGEGICEFAPPHGRILLDEGGQVVGMMACLRGDELVRCRMLTALALSKSGLIEPDGPVCTRLKLAGESLIQPQSSDYYLSRLAVVAKSRRRGFGQYLISQFEKEAKSHGCCRMILEVCPDHEAAVGLYQRSQFDTLSHRRVESHPGGPVLQYVHMAKSLVEHV